MPEQLRQSLKSSPDFADSGFSTFGMPFDQGFMEAFASDMVLTEPDFFDMEFLRNVTGWWNSEEEVLDSVPATRNDSLVKKEPGSSGDEQTVDARDIPIPSLEADTVVRNDRISEYARASDTSNLASRAIAVWDLTMTGNNTKMSQKNRGPAAKKTPFPFMRLPRELRYKIYDSFLKAKKGIFINSKKSSLRDMAYRCLESDCKSEAEAGGKGWTQARVRVQRHLARTEDPIDITLLRVSKEIWQEASQVLYGQSFTFGDTAAMQIFLIKLGARMTAQLRYVRINSWSLSGSNRISNLPAFSLLREATKLNRLEINSLFVNPKKIPKSVTGIYLLAEFLATTLYKAAYPWIEAVYSTYGRKLLAYPASKEARERFGRILKISAVNFDPAGLGLGFVTDPRVPDNEVHDKIIIPEMMCCIHRLITGGYL